ncbi:MAG: WYL domain-containing protein, partial [Ruminococcus sp.]
MAYNELIKNFSKVREYISQFFIYGFKSRNEYDAKSARSYDNERRRIESWLGEYMSFRQNPDGKNVFFAVDSRCIPSNPLYNVFKAKSFTSNDITLHFCILDMLVDCDGLSAGEIAEKLSDEYFSAFDNSPEPDLSTIRKKLKEYEKLGILKSRKQGNQILYSRNESDVQQDKWSDAIKFFSEASPLGVVGSYLLDKQEKPENIFSFKHHYILHTLESEVLYPLLCAITDELTVSLEAVSSRSQRISQHKAVPLEIRISTRSGRRYLLFWHEKLRRMMLFRLDSVKSVKLLEKAENIEKLRESAKRFDNHLWGASTGKDRSLDHVEMTVYVGENEEYMINRLEREKRNGKIIPVDSHRFKFVADVYDAVEMLPWIRTFTGRITKLTSTNPTLLETFNEDLKAMQFMYGG